MNLRAILRISTALARRDETGLISPVFEDPQGKWPGLEPRMLVEWILADGLPCGWDCNCNKFIWTRRPKGFEPG